ncbi:MAG: DUF6607 family protein, partial [Gammaproteobacteria bacterium]
VQAADEAKPVQRYTFSWPLSSDPASAPRGGTTRGPEVELDKEPSSAWKALQEAGLTPFERDRRAILAMAGGYRVTFDFLETVDFRPTLTRERPYQSWGTEYVYVREDRGNFISLQHVLVMRVIGKDGKVSEPFVTKHWRQDWSYQDDTLIEYLGRETWQKRTISKGDAAGSWTQAVYQVDDSPRYQSFGRWQHADGVSTWIGGQTWRPLPRREWSVRKDYDLLIGTNRHTITARGWVQEENNLKAVSRALGALRASQPYLAREYGVARYDRIKNFDFSAGDRYFERTGFFWNAVRKAWEQRFAAAGRITLKAPVDQANLFEPLFEQAQRLANGKQIDSAEQAAFIDKALDSMIRPDASPEAWRCDFHLSDFAHNEKIRRTQSCLNGRNISV